MEIISTSNISNDKNLHTYWNDRNQTVAVFLTNLENTIREQIQDYTPLIYHTDKENEIKEEIREYINSFGLIGDNGLNQIISDLMKEHRKGNAIDFDKIENKAYKSICKKVRTEALKKYMTNDDTNKDKEKTDNETISDEILNIETETLEPFTIGTDSRLYEVKATLINGKYNKIAILELFDNKNFSFVFDVENNVCKFVYDNKMIFPFKYSFNDGGFVIKSKTEFKGIIKDIKDSIGIIIPKTFEYSLINYLSGLYGEIESTLNASAEIKHYESNIDITIDDDEIKKLIISIRNLFEERTQKGLEKGRRELSKLLSDFYGVILRKYTGDLYKVNGVGYEITSHDDLITELTKLFGSNFIHDNDLKKALGFISERLEPKPNIIKFENTLFDMDKLEPFESDNPIFTVLNIPYKYNPNAESTMFKEFLNTTFKRDTTEETKEVIKGVKQLIGYLFTSGNSFEIIIVFTGVTGAGKSTLLNILTGIFGKDKISGISLQALEKDTHASSGFVNKHLNIIRDSDDTPITNNSILKNLTGNEAYPVNPKFKTPFDLPAEEVPKQILSCNNMPPFKKYEDAIIRRFVILEYKQSMTKNDTAIKDLDKLILFNENEVEWFIYESIQAYKEMIMKQEDFILKISDKKTKELIEKHTHPLNHILRLLILKHDPEAYDTEKNDFNNDFRPVFTDDLVDVILYVSNEKGIDVPVDKHGRINKKKLIGVIRDEFDLNDGEIVKNKYDDEYGQHREYIARAERYKGELKKAYPNLITTPEYIKYLKKVKNEMKNKIQNKE